MRERLKVIKFERETEAEKKRRKLNKNRALFCYRQRRYIRKRKRDRETVRETFEETEKRDNREKDRERYREKHRERLIERLKREN